MTDSFDQNQTDIDISLDTIDAEIRSGLISHIGRLTRDFIHEEFLAGRNEEFVQRRTSEEWIDYVSRPKRTSKLTRGVCRKLSDSLYSPGPTRKFRTGNAQVDTWLNMVYETNHVTAIMQKADQKAVLNATSALQVVCGGRPEKPVTIYLWGAHEFVPFMYPDDPCCPWAVVTIQRERRFDHGQNEERLTFEAWSRDEYRVYETQWIARLNEGVGSTYYPNDHFRHPLGNTAKFDPKRSGKNPYGCLPFTFVHDELPVSSFWEGGIGIPLVRCNKELDRELSDLAQVVKIHMAPDGFLRNVAVSWRREKRTGGWQILTPGPDREGEAAPAEPDAFFVQPTLAVEQVLLNNRHYADSTLEELDVPLTTIHDNQSVETSGIALAIKRIPLTDRVRARQPAFTKYELDLVQLILTASGNYYGDEPTSVNADQLLQAAVDPKAEILWPEPQFSYPTPERDQQDDWEMQTNQKSLVDVVAQRCGCTREQAIERIKQVIDDNKLLATIIPPPEPAIDPAAKPGEEPIGKNKPQPDPSNDPGDGSQS